MTKYLALVALMTFATALFASLIIFDEPPAIFAFTFGAFTGAGWIGIIALWVRRCERD